MERNVDRRKGPKYSKSLDTADRGGCSVTFSFHFFLDRSSANLQMFLCSYRLLPLCCLVWPMVFVRIVCLLDTNWPMQFIPYPYQFLCWVCLDCKNKRRHSQYPAWCIVSSRFVRVFHNQGIIRKPSNCWPPEDASRPHSSIKPQTTSMCFSFS